MMKYWQFSSVFAQTNMIMSCVVSSPGLKILFMAASAVCTCFVVAEMVLDFQIRRLTKENERLRQQKENGSAGQDIR